MGFMFFSFLMLVGYCLVSPSLSWKLPAKEFLDTFAQTFQTEGVSIFIPDGRNEKMQVLSAMKHLR